MKRILVTGGTGYIGSHVCLELLLADYEVIAIDNLSNSSEESLKRVRNITNKDIIFHKVDLLDKQELNKVLSKYKVDAVIHFAGLKAVGESVELPLKYYFNNVVGTLNLCEAMIKNNVKTIVFSSSCTVYGVQEKMPIKEDCPLQPSNPYGRSKRDVEEILNDIYNMDASWNIVLLRYFNPVGAHGSGQIGESPLGTPNNLLPYIAQVAVGKLPELHVFGDDYPTPDGTGVRDYIHVLDLSRGHIRALESKISGSGVHVYNLGTGKGCSVFEMISAFEKVSGKKINFQINDRRSGDSAICYADSQKAQKELGWAAEYDIEKMCEDAWRWQECNPNGYE